MSKKQKTRRNSFDSDFNTKDDDFILADLDEMLNEKEPSPVHLNHFLDDEEIIDRLLINPDFEAHDDADEDPRKANAPGVDELTDLKRFNVEPVKHAKHNRYIEAEEPPEPDSYSMTDFEEISGENDAIDRLLVDDGFDANDELEQDDGKTDVLEIDEIGFHDEPVVEPVELAEQYRHIETEDASDSDIHFMAHFDEIQDEKDAIDRLLVNVGFNAKDELEQGDENTDAFLTTYKSPVNAFDVNFEKPRAIVADAGLLSSEDYLLGPDKNVDNIFLEENKPHRVAQQEQAINQTTYPEVLEENTNNAADLAVLSSVISEQTIIKKQLNAYENKVKKAAIITYSSLGFGLIALLSTAFMGVIVSGMQTKVSRLTELVSILEEDMSGIVEKDSDIDINNNDTSFEPLKKNNNSQPEQLQPFSQTRAPVQEKKKPIKTTATEKKLSNTQESTGWSVNLPAYDDLSYAKSKAAKFIQKGVPVKVKAVEMNSKTWYRLKVGGFKNKEDAASYAAKIQKSLNLNTVFVGNS